MSSSLKIDGFEIYDGSDCYVIAEIGNNHQGSLAKCKEMFRVAAECGANAVKLQKRDNRSLYTKAAFDKPYEHENSFGLTYGEHREFLEFGKYEYVELKEYAKKVGITFFSTAFDFPSADFLAALDMPAYKIASGDLTNIPLLKYVAQFQKPMIVSTGGGTMADVQRAYDAIMPINPQLCLLQCTASYPANFEELDLQVINTYRAQFPDVVAGLSSHDNGIAMAVAAYVLGANVVEKHFTLNRAMKGTDHAFSLEPTGLRKMVRDLRRTRQAMGNGEKKVHLSERQAVVKMGKKLVAARDLPIGHVLTASDIAIKSPGDGLPPYLLENMIGKVLTQPLQADESIILTSLADG
ncbi:MAG: N-acetylneuraminate synthase family protein [Gomphosphaeria aponina SAG 52.96 = DSM 107014]|uniref:N-acetylneuraminate synthase family protein n=1 Tax=Gomphosphaeria aponina SAG 52.96 = DSM 107014 TaxID=1521640 RepID=A0A941GNT4_9CHRO|nr:N-acetylneuraminate synthase family protein [Gomphosphaeria aponina SAG 52.96 = DSM 107014]